MKVVVPDYFEPVLGWRTWLVVEQAGALRLRSIVFDNVWPRRRELAAACAHPPPRLLSRPWRRARMHDAPLATCACGIYATTNVERAARYLDLDGNAHQSVRHRVLGRVLLWGSVVETEFGWRASHAYPAHIYVPTHSEKGARVDAEGVAIALADYGVPVEIVAGAVGSDTPITATL